MSGGLRTSVKSDIIAKRVAEALEINTVREDETSTNVTGNSTAADSVVHPPPLSVSETSMALASYGFNVCDGNIPCLPILSSAAKVHKSNSDISFSFYMYVMYLREKLNPSQIATQLMNLLKSHS
jgi:hypothetical protein